jgi:limonene-1,2-epoxide hydrolase
MDSDTPTPEQIVDRFIACVVAMDLDGACALVTDDLEYDNVPMGKNHGPEGLRTFLGPMVDGLDEVEFVILRQTATGGIVMNERVDRFRVGERWMDLPVAGVFEVTDEGLIRLWRDYFDLGTMMTQMAELAG